MQVEGLGKSLPFPSFKGFIYFYVYRWVLPACMSVQYLYAYYVWKLGEGVLEIKKIVSCHMVTGI